MKGLADRIERDPSLSSIERETHIGFAAGDDHAAVRTDEPALIRRLLAHPYFEPDCVKIIVGDRRLSRTLDDARTDHPDAPIVAVRGELPVAAVSIASEPRSNNEHRRVISDRVLDDGDREVSDE